MLPMLNCHNSRLFGNECMYVCTRTHVQVHVDVHVPVPMHPYALHALHDILILYFKGCLPCSLRKKREIELEEEHKRTKRWVTYIFLFKSLIHLKLNFPINLILILFSLFFYIFIFLLNPQSFFFFLKHEYERLFSQITAFFS